MKTDLALSRFLTDSHSRTIGEQRPMITTPVLERRGERKAKCYQGNQHNVLNIRITVIEECLRRNELHQYASLYVCDSQLQFDNKEF